jgi:hypothetical protein
MQSNDLFELLEREWLEAQAGEPISGEGPIELQGARLAASCGYQQPDSFVGESMRDEAKNIGRRWVEPLDVVDRQHRRRLGGRSPEHAQSAARQADPVRRALALGSQKCQFQRETLRLGKKLDGFVRHAFKEIAEAEKRERALRLGRPTDEKAVRATTPGVRRRALDGGLSDP